MEDLIKGEFEWHEKVNANFHELDSNKANAKDLNNLKTSTEQFNEDNSKQLDGKVSKPTNANENNIALFDSTKNIKDSGKSIGNASGKILELPLGLQPGDLFRVNASGQVERLPKGLDSQVLSMIAGVPAWGSSTSNVKEFTTSGTYAWTVPSGVDVVYITAVGAGGGGGGGSSVYNSRVISNFGKDGGAGGITSFGSILSINGGSGGRPSHYGATGTNLSSYVGIGGTNTNLSTLFSTSGKNGSPGTCGGQNENQGGEGGNNFIGNGIKRGTGGVGGKGGRCPNNYYLSDGNNANGNNSGTGGGAGGYVFNYPVTVTPGSVIQITIGDGGSGGKGGDDQTVHDGSGNTTKLGGGGDGENGTCGFMRIEW